MTVKTNPEPTVPTQTPPANEPTNQPEKVNNPEAVLAKNKELLTKNKSLKDELEELREFKKAQNLKDEESKGNYQSVIDSLRTELQEEKGKSTNLQKNFAFQSFSGQIKQAAREEGCVNVDKLMRLMTKEQMQSVEMDSDFNVNRDDLSRLMGELKEEHKDIGLFRNKQVNINNINGSFRAQEPKSLNELSKEDIKDRLRALNK